MKILNLLLLSLFLVSLIGCEERALILEKTGVVNGGGTHGNVSEETLWVSNCYNGTYRSFTQISKHGRILVRTNFNDAPDCLNLINGWKESLDFFTYDNKKDVDGWIFVSEESAGMSPFLYKIEGEKLLQLPTNPDYWDSDEMNFTGDPIEYDDIIEYAKIDGFPELGSRPN